MTTYTQDELATRVLKDLGVLGVDETPSSADLADAVEIIVSEIQQMAVRGIQIWNGSEVTIPSEYLTALSRRLALAVGPSYGMFSVADATAAIVPSESLLRQLSNLDPTGAVSRVDYF